ncbi:FadR family transcriptional regulator [bacterium]|nr:MAG: FadR family transcriptional regulator [bacterium]
MQHGRPRRSKLSDHVVLHLAREIVSGRLAPGEAAAPAAEMAVGFEISQPVVRESIHALVNLGMLRVHQGKRTQVLPPREWNVMAPIVQQAYLLEGRADKLTAHFYEVRLALESRAASWAAERAGGEELARLQRLAQQLYAISTGTRDVEAFLAVDHDFHTAVASASGNEVLLGVLRNLQVFLSRAWSASRVAAQHLALLAEQHGAIARAIAAGDSKAASHAMEDHIQWAMQLEASGHDRRDSHAGRVELQPRSAP